VLKPGDQIGPYEIRGFVGQGGMGQVYKAFDPRLERTVALKVIVVPDKLSETDSARAHGEFSARLLREARAVASLSHPNVVAVFDVGESNGRLYFAMEYVVGSSLRALATDEAPVARKVRWLIDVARALEAAHKVGLVHRDVKPENVMVREDGVVKVLDFGIARRTITGPNSDPHIIDTVTGGGAIAGTPVYMAPEQIKGSEIDARCDQFAWAVMAYEILAGTRPWADSGDVLSLVAKILTDPAPPLREKAKDVPGGVEDTIHRALSKDPAGRYASMADVVDALEPFATQSSAKNDRVRVTPPPLSPKSTEPAAYAATTRIPTSISVKPTAEKEPEPPAKKRPAWQLALPLLLIAMLVVVTVAIVKRKPAMPITAARPLSTVPAAETAYVDAMRLWHDGATAKVQETLVHATELDPTFAAAHLQLAVLTLAEDPQAAQEHYQNAYEHRYLLLPRDSVFLEANEPYIRAKPDLPEWETRLWSAARLYPRDADIQFYLGRARERQGQDDTARVAYENAVRIDDRHVPALAQLASVLRSLGDEKKAIATTDKCLEASRIAAQCLATRVQIWSDLSECHRMREEAEQWRLLEPQSPRAYSMFARALHADGGKRPGVEEALARRWSLLPAPARARAEAWDRMYLAIVDGDLVHAEQLAKDFDAALPKSADRYDHAEPAGMRARILGELDRPKEAAAVAKDYLDKMEAWAPYLLAPDGSIGFWELLYRGGVITRAQLDDERASWREKERKRVASEHHGPYGGWIAWNLAWGSLVETREEAFEAIAHLPRDEPMPIGTRRGIGLDFNLGKVYALAGRADDAIPPLQRVTGTCLTLDNTLFVVRARYYLGLAYEAKNEIALAKSAYERTLATWPKSSGSRTLKRAEDRLKALSGR
jgi:serine/threonine protein kinase/tetratricopeptide (TPR) repeat protein